MPIGDLLNYVILLLGIVAMAIVLTLLVRIQRGLLGIVLGAGAVALLAYWVIELRKIVKKEFSLPTARTKWVPDLLNKGDEIVLVGMVPGPESSVKVEFRDGVLQIQGGQGFHESVILRQAMRIKEMKYANRVLHVRLTKKLIPSVEEE